MSQVGGLLSTIVLVVIAIFVLVGILIYTLALQRRAVATQKAVVDDHFSEKAQRKRHLDLAEEALEIQKRSVTNNAEALELMRRSVRASEEILKVLRPSRDETDGGA